MSCIMIISYHEEYVSCKMYFMDQHFILSGRKTQFNMQDINIQTKHSSANGKLEMYKIKKLNKYLRDPSVIFIFKEICRLDSFKVKLVILLSQSPF